MSTHMPTHMSAHIIMHMSAHIFIACTCVQHRSLLPSLFAKHSYGLYSYGLYSYGLYSYGLCSYGQYRGATLPLLVPRRAPTRMPAPHTNLCAGTCRPARTATPPPTRSRRAAAEISARATPTPRRSGATRPAWPQRTRGRHRGVRGETRLHARCGISRRDFCKTTWRHRLTNMLP